MRGVSGFRRQLGMRRLPRPAYTGSSPDLISVSGLPGRRSRYGEGPGGTSARQCVGRGLEAAVPCKVTVRALSGRLMPIPSGIALRPAARSSQAPPQGVTRCGVQPHGITGASKRPCRRPADISLGASSRGAGKAAAFSRCALPIRRAGVVSTVSASERVETTLGLSRRQNCKPLNKGGLWIFNAQKMPFWARNARKRAVQNG